MSLLDARWYIARPGDVCRNTGCRSKVNEPEGGWITFKQDYRVFEGAIDGFGGYLTENKVRIFNGWCPRCVKRYGDMVSIQRALIDGNLAE